MVPKRETAMTEATAVDDMRGAETAAMDHGATASDTATMKRRAAAMEASAAVETATAMTTATAATTVATATAMAATDLGRQTAGDVLRGGRRTRIDQRKCLRALGGRRRQHQGRGSRKAPTTDEAADQTAPCIWNFHHA